MRQPPATLPGRRPAGALALLAAMPAAALAALLPTGPTAYPADPFPLPDLLVDRPAWSATPRS